MASYNTSQFKKGLKVQLDGDPYLMVECNFVKPGKGQALYKCKLKNLIRQTMLDRTYKSGDSLDAADVEEIDAQYLYRQGEQFVFMDNTSYEQYELNKEQRRRNLEVDQGRHRLPDDAVQQQPDQRRAAKPHGAQGRVLRAGGPRQHGHQPDQAGASWKPAQRSPARRSSTSAT